MSSITAGINQQDTLIARIRHESVNLNTLAGYLAIARRR